MAFPTRETQPTWPWVELPPAPGIPPGIVYALLPWSGGAKHLYVYSKRTGHTYEKICQRGPEGVRATLAQFAQFYA